MAPPPLPHPSPVADGPDEFGEFLSDVSATVAQQVDRWRQRVTEASLRYAAEGFRTARLDTLLAQEISADPDTTLVEFERDVAALRHLQAELAEIAPALLTDTVLHDPDRVAEAETLLADTREAGEPLPGPSPRYTLEQFSEGPSTRSMLEAIRSAAEAHWHGCYNPLVIVGKAGVGKTHLLNAFGHELRAAGLARVAVLGRGMQFVDGLVAALGDGSISRWRQRLRRVDALLVDDVGSLAGKERSQEEFYLLYNLLLESGRQMAFYVAGDTVAARRLRAAARDATRWRART